MEYNPIKTKKGTKSKKAINVWLVDDNKDFCTILCEALNETKKVVCKQYHTYGQDAIRSLKETSDIPSVILLDINMPGLSGVEVLQAIKKQAQQIKVIMLTINDREDNIYRAIQLGASGYLLKTSSIEEITEAIQSVIKGGVPINPFVAQKMIALFAFNPISVDQYKLTKTEKEIISYTCSGMKTAEIAKQMEISQHTIRTHFKKIFKKLDVHTRAALTAKSIKEKIV